ncbi:uncharacterized protein N7483_009706 [Penicillium malachiteum]|uniref:uncharacterized protein n=1 Tax=Penicillium malachiteum TaxID=1324776 RepID=UPI002549A595|nr:uncharacterized protein N7483_009706 [Penicillium malachiteum]KAJ5721772.1 hypothetical protein N7483_009706 [Penicillium malachiteum]
MSSSSTELMLGITKKMAKCVKPGKFCRVSPPDDLTQSKSSFDYLVGATTWFVRTIFQTRSILMDMN